MPDSKPRTKIQKDKSFVPLSRYKKASAVPYEPEYLITEERIMKKISDEKSYN